MAKKSEKSKKNNVKPSSFEGPKSKDPSKIEIEGKVVEVLKGGAYKVKLENGHSIEAYVSGKMRVHMIRILPGDTVRIELTPYDLTRGRIIWNKR